MRLVVISESGDGSTFSGQNVFPVEYESAEAFAVDFEEACKKDYEQQSYKSFRFTNQSWTSLAFFDEGEYYGPTILTVDEWYECST